MQFAIHSNCREIINAIDATLTSNQNAFNALLKNFEQIELKLNTKISIIKELYKTKEKNANEIIL